MAEPLPSGHEAALILGEVAADDRVVYLGGCACLPLAQEIAEKVNGRGRLVITGRAEVLEDKWRRLPRKTSALEGRNATSDCLPCSSNPG